MASPFSMATTLLLLLSLLLFLSPLAIGDHHHHHHRSPKPLPSPTPKPTPDSSSPPPQIQRACNATRFPSTCIAALSNSSSLPPSPYPSDLIAAAAAASSAGIASSISAAQSILAASAADRNRSNAARNCLEFLSFSSRRLSAAVSLTPGDLAGARALAGAALLYQYDCWSAFKYVNGTQQVSDAMADLATLGEKTSNALAFIAALQRYGGDTSIWAPPQTERDGYWGPTAGAGAGGGGSLPGVPVGLEPNATVCKTGGCRFGSVQTAVDAAPDHGPSRFVIYIKAGVYEETVRVPYEKTNLAFVGDGMGKTVITGSLNADTVGVSTYNTATVGVLGDGFMARDLTFANAAGPDAHQAVAFRSDSDRSVLDSVEFLGHQDTLYAHSLRQLYVNCRVAGTVDFIFGNSAAVFVGSRIVVLPRQLNPERGESNTVTAQGRTDPGQPTGFVFQRCNVTGSDDYLKLYRGNPKAHRVYLGRPWKEYSRTVFVDSYLGEIIRPEGWLPWDGGFALKTLFYGEFGSTGPGAAVAGRVPWSNQIPAEHLGAYSLDNFIQGNQWLPSDQ